MYMYVYMLIHVYMVCFVWTEQLSRWMCTNETSTCTMPTHTDEWHVHTIEKVCLFVRSSSSIGSNSAYWQFTHPFISRVSVSFGITRIQRLNYASPSLFILRSVIFCLYLSISISISPTVVYTYVCSDFCICRYSLSLLSMCTIQMKNATVFTI